jgi:two-component system, NtrC family, response regulator HydG
MSVIIFFQSLRAVTGKISGKGVLQILDLNVNTLNSRMKKLGIQKEISAKKS